MTIWLINPYGPIPGESWRDYRFTIIGQTLTQHGHRVIWWTANFSHHFKTFRSVDWGYVNVSPHFQIRLVPTAGYGKHIGLGRVWFELRFGYRMYHRALQESPPACIIAIDPPQTVGFVAVKLARHFGARLILDVMDLWPELFVLACPRWCRRFASYVFYPLRALRRRNYRQADAITSLCETYLEVARREVVHLRKLPCVTIFNGIDVEAVRAMSRETIGGSPGLTQKVGTKGRDEVWAVYAGSLGNNYDIETLLQAALCLEQRKSRIRILIAGEGPLRRLVVEFVARHGATKLAYLGKLPPKELFELYRLCDIGICAYGVDSNVAMPDKIYDYMAAGLPIISSLRGELERLLRNHQIGIQYQAGDPKSLADALELLATDQERRRVMSLRSYKAAEQFDRHRQYGKFVELIGELFR